jgi:hypothetical protein
MSANPLPSGVRAPVALLVLGVCAGPLFSAEPASEAAEFFEKKVRPVLVEHCFKCHGNGKKKGSLSLDSRAGLLKGGDSGPAVVPGRPQASRLVEAVGYKNVELQMPPRGKLPDDALADLAAWIRMGAPWPADRGPGTGEATRAAFDLERRKREHWAWRPVRAAPPPAVRDATWPRGPVDAFVLAKLEEKGLTPAPPADRRTWLRRVSFDLVGLPPTPAEVDAFLADSSPEAEARVVDRLLASPHFGERWGRHWLDLVRYAETRGHEFDYPVPNAWQYRDYVIRALNADVPYDAFVTEHLAGDLLEEPRRHPAGGFNESVLGTGFWFLGEELHSPVDVALDEADRFDNRIDVMGKAFLGLTVACARCHDHKFDAISTRDYYALYGLLAGCGYRQVRFDTCGEERAAARDLARLRAEGRARVGRLLAEGMRPTAGRLADYLLAAREAIQTGPAVVAGADLHSRVEPLARSRKLDPTLLARWVARLLQAAQQADDPLHAFGRVALDPAAGDPRHLAEVLRPLAEGMHRRQAAAASPRGEVVIDYGRCTPADWMPDGGAFGTGPIQSGTLLVEGTPERPVFRVADRGAAEVDRAWPRLRTAAGTENDPGVVGGMVRAGRTLRTPSFTVAGGKVFYLVRGAGQAYASVQSHVLIAGPLHGSLVLAIRAGGWQWVGHDLTRYRGCRAHIEFTPREGDDFAVAAVVQADAPPPPPAVPGGMLDLLARDAGSVEALAAGYQRLVGDVLDKLAEDRLVGESTRARLADDVVRHPELFDAGDGPTRRANEAAAALLTAQARRLARLRPESRLAPGMLDGTSVDGRVFLRGSPKALGERVPARFLEALAGTGRLPGRGSGRLALARQVTDPALNPFLARVLVNRVWHHLFGRGLVASVDNFGALGEAPSHPELLDHLAAEFVRRGWSVKTLVRTLVLSRTYRMSSRADPQGDTADPEDLLLHRMRVRRLEGEAIRDALLAVSGRLEPRLYGTPVPVSLTDFQTGRGRPASGPLDGDGRRSVYLSVRRNFLSPLLLAFDTPIPFSTVGRRSVSNVPAQALILLNDPLVHQQAAAWARRLLREGGTPAGRVEEMYREAFGRPPTGDERRRCLDFLAQQARLDGDDPDAPGVWADLAHVLFNTKEFIYLD